MKILFDHQTFLLQKHGGISRYFFELITGLLAKTDVTIDLFMGIHINGYGLEKYSARCDRFFGIRRPDVSHLLTLSLALNRLLFSKFAGKATPDIYHQTYFYDLASPPRVKRVVTVYDMIYELYPEIYAPHDKTAPNKNVAVSRADAIICISHSTKADLIRLLHVPEEKVKVVYLGNSLTQDVTTPPVVGRPYILYVGKRDAYKNFSLVLDAFARSARIRNNFVLVCAGGGEFDRSETDRITSLGITERVLRYGGSDDVLANLYRHAALLVYPSLYEGFGIPPLEAMHYGCPVVVSRASAIPEVVGDAGLYFDPHSREELAGAMERVVDDPVLCASLAAAGHSRERLFTWERCVQQTYQVYESLLTK